MSRLRPTIVRAVSALVAFAAFTVPARAEGPGPAYLVEPGEQPPNAVQMDPSGSVPEAAPEETPPQDEGAYYEGGYDAAPEAAEPSASAVADDDPRALGAFAPRLDPYGSWTTDPSYGQVWVPDSSVVGTGFSPYLTDGHWAADASGSQVWMSDYPFGDVVFHYGRWVWMNAGWGWIPGYRYAPAWVAWRVPTDGAGYYGWAPLPPSFVWVNQAAVGLPWRSSYYWVFCPGNFVHSASPSSYIVRSPAEAQTVAVHTRAYVPASPRPTNPAAAGAVARAAPRLQQWAPGYRPMIRARASVTAAPATMNGAVAPRVAASIARPPPAAVRPPPGAAVMHAAMPMRAPVFAPHVVNAAPARTYPAAFRGGGIRR